MQGSSQSHTKSGTGSISTQLTTFSLNSTPTTHTDGTKSLSTSTLRSHALRGFPTYTHRQTDSTPDRTSQCLETGSTCVDFHYESQHDQTLEDVEPQIVDLKTPVRLKKCIVLVLSFLVLLVILLLAATATLAILYSLEINKKDNSTLESKKYAVCKTESCWKVAVRMLQYMDKTVDPCQDFYQYSCGGFQKTVQIPQGHDEISIFSMAGEEINSFLWNLVAGTKNTDDPSYVKKMKDYYQTCTDETGLDSRAARWFKNSGFYDQWPSLNMAWTEGTKTKKDLVITWAQELMSAIVDFGVSKDRLSGRFITYISAPDFYLIKAKDWYAYDPRFKDTLKNYYFSMLYDLYATADEQTIKNDAKAVVDFMVELARIPSYTYVEMELDHHYRDAINSKTNLETLGLTYPSLHIPSMIETAFQQAGVAVDGSLDVLDISGSLLDRYEKLFEKTDLRTLYNFYSFRFALETVSLISCGQRKDTLIVEGTTHKEHCMDDVKKYFSKALNKQFAMKKIPSRSKDRVTEIIEKEIEEFKNTISKLSWMSKTTKGNVLHKLSQMKYEVGYPSTDFSEADISEFYKNFHIQTRQHFENQVNVMYQFKVSQIKLLQKTVSVGASPKWLGKITAKTAYYDIELNKLYVNGGLMQSPIFDDSDVPKFFDNAKIGSIIGHEILLGLLYNGTHGNWEKTGDLDELKAKAKCVKEQYSKFKIKKTNQTVNGTSTFYENMADAGGIKHAYMTYLASTRLEKDEVLPILKFYDMSPEQLFFVSFAQLMCEKMSPDYRPYESAFRSPSNFRVIGSLQSLEEFSQVFNCPVGSYMNPKRKCTVW